MQCFSRCFNGRLAWFPYLLGLVVVLGWPGDAQTAVVDLNSCLTAHWSFNEPSGTVAHNSTLSSGTLDGTLQGDAAFVSGGMFGNAISMTSTGYVKVANEVIPDASPEYTYSVWFKSTASSGQHYLLESTPSTVWPMSARLTPSTPLPKGTLEVFSFTTGNQIVPPFSVDPINKWNLLVVTYKQGEDIKTYLNGSLQSTLPVTGSLAATSGLNIGADRSGGRSWQGQLDDIGIWTRVLNTDEIAYLWNNGNGNPLPTLVDPFRGLVANWSMNESSGTIAHNSVQSSLNGTLQGNAQFAPGKFGNAVLLDGSGDYVDVTNEVIPDGAPAYTVAAWFKPTNLAAGRQFLLESSGGSWAISVELNANQKIAYSVETDGTYVIQGTNITPTQNEWSFVVVTYDQLANLTQIYLNGGELGAYRGTPSGTLKATDGLHIGTYRNADGRWFTGLIDEVSVWNRVLNAAEVAYLWNNGIGLQIVPEPATWVLVGLGGILILPWMRRKTKKRL